MHSWYQKAFNGLAWKITFCHSWGDPAMILTLFTTHEIHCKAPHLWQKISIHINPYIILHMLDPRLYHVKINADPYCTMCGPIITQSCMHWPTCLLTCLICGSCASFMLCCPHCGNVNRTKFWSLSVDTPNSSEVSRLFLKFLLNWLQILHMCLSGR